MRDIISELNRDHVILVEKIDGVRKVRVHFRNRVSDYNTSFWGISRFLDKRFVKCSENCYVNKEEIQAYDTNGKSVLMSNGEQCVVKERFTKRIQLQMV